MPAIASIYASLDLNSAKFRQSMDSTMKYSDKRMRDFKRSVKDISRGINTALTASFAAATAGSAALVVATKRTLDYSREMQNLAAISGATAQALQRDSYAVATANMSQEKYADILKDTNDKIGDFLQTGAGPMKDFFENIAPKIGVTADQFRGLSGREGLLLYASSLEKANLSQAETTFYMEALASDSTALLPLLRDNAEGLNAIGEEAEAVGAVLTALEIAQLEAMNREIDRSRMHMDGLRNQIALGVVPAVTALTQMFNDASAASGGFGNMATTASEAVATSIGFVLDEVQSLNRAWLEINLSIAEANEWMARINKNAPTWLLDGIWGDGAAEHFKAEFVEAEQAVAAWQTRLNDLNDSAWSETFTAKMEQIKQELKDVSDETDNLLGGSNDKNKKPDAGGSGQAPRYDNLNMLDQLREYHMGELDQINKHHQDRVNAALELNLSEQQIAQAGFESRAALNAEIIKLSEQRRDKEFDILSEAAGKKFTDEEARLQQQRDMMERSHKEMLNSFKIRRADQLEAEGRIAEAGKLRREAEVEQLRLHQASKLADLKAAKDEELLTTEEYAQRKAEIEIQYAEEVARTKAELEEQATRAKLEQVNSQVGVMGDFYGNLAQLAGKNSREQRALMIAQATAAAIQTGINTYNQASAVMPPPAPAIFAGVAVAAQMASVAQLKSQSVGSYEDGGFIPGTSYRGDNLVANVNSGEAVLNAGQQREFMRLANGGGTANSAPVFNFYGLPAQPKVTRNEQGGYDFDFTDAFRDMLDSPEGDRVFTSAVRKVS
ncbi:MAG: hypothetical protein SVC26_02540 [Pseudomonadota bacterium]|nr:hypothetical protein [Pseudomonadota bacterium]